MGGCSEDCLFHLFLTSVPNHKNNKSLCAKQCIFYFRLKHQYLKHNTNNNQTPTNAWGPLLISQECSWPGLNQCMVQILF
ncbi:hypothetical protein FKM82_003552 [Ascaphus truei]